MSLTLPAAMIDEIIAHARAEVPNECCGIIGGSNGSAVRLIRATNAEQSPYRYSIAPREILTILDELDELGAEVMVIYHSHTHTPAYPSPTDVRFSGGFPDAYYLLVSLAEAEPDVRAYHMRDGAVTEEQLLRA